MKRLISLLLETAIRLELSQQECAELAEELTELEHWRKTMPLISQSQIDALTAEVAAATAATNDTAARVGTMQTDLSTVKAEVATLTQQLADAGAPFDSTALDTALHSLTTEAEGIAQTAASTPAPVVPVADPANPSGPVVPPGTTGTPPGTTGTPGDTTGGAGSAA